ncbi:hypothetical protein GA0070560_10522 [Micromonospora halophytica]|uniref:Uncharacterized protein n=1 Tax=Micromonospora halophytica TaxID=47864 RepID=A0A1C5HLE4_9ACTN|nr:hypothetical protein GA0070560_10522 [Micromonospora halophytica]
MTAAVGVPTGVVVPTDAIYGILPAVDSAVRRTRWKTAAGSAESGK